MLPPSSPQHYQPRSAVIPPHASLPPATGPYPPRDAPAPSAHRPGSSMSISSMLGSDSDRPPRDTGSSIYHRPSMTSAPPSQPAHHTPSGQMSPPTVPSRQPSSELPAFRRSHTPDRSLFSKTQPSRAYRSSSGGTPQGPSLSLDENRFGSVSRHQGHPFYADKQHPSLQSPSVSSAVESQYNQDRRMSLSGAIQRPSSQPHADELPPRTSLFSPISKPTSGYGDPGPREPGIQRIGPGYGGIEPLSQSQRYGPPFHEHRSQEIPVQEKEYTGFVPQEVRQQIQQQPPQYPQFASQPNTGRDADRVPRAWDSVPRHPSPEATRVAPAEPSSSFGFPGVQSYPKPAGLQSTAPRSVPGSQAQPRPEPGHSMDTPFNTFNKFHQPQRNFSPTPAASSRPLFGAEEQQHRKGSEELLQHRSLLNAEVKRTGRASPLPQAVQGAQAQIIGPAEEAGIKTELGRVFSGIGSGVGVSAPGVPGNNGPSTTSVTSSPLKRKVAPAGPTDNLKTEAPVSKPSRAGSGIGSGRRGRKPKDEEHKADGEGGAGQRDSTSSRGGRRPRHTHHHHHQ